MTEIGLQLDKNEPKLDANWSKVYQILTKVRRKFGWTGYQLAGIGPKLGENWL